MELREPFRISARLLPALVIGNAWLSWDWNNAIFHLDLPKVSFEITEYRAGRIHGTQVCFQDILGFLIEAVEGNECRANFVVGVIEWAEQNVEALSDIQMRLENDTFIKE